MKPNTHIINLPLKVIINKKGDTFLLNLNAYRNTHFHVLNKAKEVFEEQVSKIIKHLPRMLKLKITYYLFVGSKRELDISNVCSIVDKFFCDTLTNNQIIPDDNMNILADVHYLFGGYDKLNPRVEAHITDLMSESEEEDKPLRIIIVQSEIETAITEYIRRQITLRDDQEISIDWKAGRGEEGYTADINIKSGSPFKAPEGTALGLENKANEQQQVSSVVQSTAPSETGSGSEPTPLTSPVASTTTEPAATPTQPVVQPVTTTLVPTEAPSGVVAPKSLFSGLTQPSNSQPQG